MHGNYRTNMIGKGDSMIIQGLGKTRMFGSTVQVAEECVVLRWIVLEVDQ